MFPQNSSIAFVGLLTFPPSRAEPFIGIVKDLSVTCRIYTNARTAAQLSGPALAELLDKGLKALPPITQGGGMSPSVKMSARKIQELLAGKISAQELLADYRRPGEPLDNPFERALKRGLTMRAVNVTSVLGCDDDLIESRFGSANPAISKLVAD